MALIAGLDEVGLGAIAGPLVVVVAAFDADNPIPPEIATICDSKKASKKKRAALAPLAAKHADFFGVGWAEAWEIDKLGVAAAWQLAASMALKCAPEFKVLLVDGTRPVRPYSAEQRTVIKGDSLHWQISAASFIAKVVRDREMVDLDEGGRYGWESGAGYGTKAHYANISEQGLCRQHRRLFTRNL